MAWLKCEKVLTQYPDEMSRNVRCMVRRVNGELATAMALITDVNATFDHLRVVITRPFKHISMVRLPDGDTIHVENALLSEEL